MSSLEEFLSVQRSTGLVDSSGSITLDPSRAMSKLARHQLEEPGLWLVKLVQAAVSARSSQISVRMGRKYLRLAFQTEFLFQVEEVLQRLFTGELPKDWTWRHLLTGLRASLAREPKRLTFARFSAGKGQRFVLEPDGSCLEEIEGEVDATYLVELEKSGEAWKLGDSLKATLMQTVDEIEALVTRCWACPAPIKLDGLELDRIYPRNHPQAPLGSFYAFEFHRSSGDEGGFRPHPAREP